MIYGGVLVIPCQLNDAYGYWFLVDRGTATTMLSRRVAVKIGLDLTKPLRHEPVASVHQVARAPVLRLNSLQVGSQRATDIEVLVLSFPPDLRVDGLHGVNFLGRFRPTFEFDLGTLVLR